MPLSPKQRSEIARKAIASRKNKVVTEPEKLDRLVDLALPVRATQGQINKSLEGLSRLLRQVAKNTGEMRVTIGPSRKESICVFLSDLHLGKLILDEQDKTLVLFNKEIAKIRLLNLLGHVTEQTRNKEIDVVVVFLGGDILDGEEIYQTQASHIEFTTTEQVQFAVEMLWLFAKGLRHGMGRDVPVRFICCPGNHGRVSRYVDELTNWDQIIYMMLQIMTSLDKDKISVEFPETRQFITGIVKGKKVLLRHRAKRGTSPSPVSQWQSWLLQHDFDIGLSGHWHTPAVEYVQDKPIFRNGSLCGKDDFAESLGLGDGPSQWIFGINQDGLTFCKLALLEEIVMEAKK